MGRRRRFDESRVRRWPARSPDSRGGEFREKTGGWLAAVADRMGSADAPRVTRTETEFATTDDVKRLRSGDHVRVRAGRAWRVTTSRDTRWAGGAFDIEVTGQPVWSRATTGHPAGWAIEGILLNQNGTRKKNNPTRMFIVEDRSDMRRLGPAPWQERAAKEAAARRDAPLPAARKGPVKASLKVRRQLDRLAATLPADDAEWQATYAQMHPEEREVDRRIRIAEETIAQWEKDRADTLFNVEKQSQQRMSWSHQMRTEQDRLDWVDEQMRYYDQGPRGAKLQDARDELATMRRALARGETPSTAHLFRVQPPKVATYAFPTDSNGVVQPTEALKAHVESVLTAGRILEEELARLLQTDREWVERERRLTDGDLSSAVAQSLWEFGRAGEYNAQIDKRHAAIKEQAKRRQQILREMLASIRSHGKLAHTRVAAADAADMDSFNHGKAAEQREMAPHPDYRQHIRTAEGYYPDDWIQRSDAAGALLIASRRRAHYRHGARVLATELYEGNQWSRNGFPSDYEETNVHELAHRMEMVIPGLRELEFAYVRRRATTRGKLQRAKKLKTIYPNSGYDLDEWSYQDEWQNAYTGKTYETIRGGTSSSSNPARFHWELLSTGVQDLFGGVRAHDMGPELDQFTFGVLALLGRPRTVPTTRRRRT